MISLPSGIRWTMLAMYGASLVSQAVHGLPSVSTLQALTLLPSSTSIVSEPVTRIVSHCTSSCCP